MGILGDLSRVASASATVCPPLRVVMPLFPARRWSLAQRISLLLFVVMATVITTFGIAAYGEVRRSAVERGSTRLAMVAREIASSLSRAVAVRLTANRRTAMAPPIVALLGDSSRQRDPRLLRAVHAMLALESPADSAVLARELRTTSGTRLARVGEVTLVDSLQAREVVRHALRRDTVALSGFYAVDSVGHVAVVVPVRAGGRVIGQYTEWYRVTGSAAAERLLEALLSGPARLMYLSAGSAVALGPSGRPTRAPFDLQATALAVDSVSTHALSIDGVERYVGAATVRGTPWRIVLIQSASVMLSRPHEVGRRFGFIALLLVLGSTLAAWWVSRQMHATLETQHAALEEANAAKARFLGVMSHELRTPLNAIAGHAELIALGIHGPTTPAQDQALARIQRNKEQLLHLVNDLLFFARVDSQPIEMASEPVPLQDQFDQLAENHRHEFERKRIALAIEPTTQILLGDAMRVQQVLANLVTNAWRFTASGGCVRVHAASARDGCEIMVEDDGIGIPAADLPTIFEPFVQGDASQTRQGGGAGLGLAIVRALVTAMHGEVRVESAEGRGTTFRVWLPVAPTVATSG